MDLACKMDDVDLARVLDAYPKMTGIKASETGFGPLALQSLTRHFSTLLGLNIIMCPRDTNVMCQCILASRPELQTFWANRLDV